MTGEELSVRLCNAAGDPLPLAGVHLDLQFYTKGDLRYSFSLGRTDAEGICRTTLGEVQQQLEANRRLFLMDYNTPLSECDTEVGIVAPTARELAERDVARAKWWPEKGQMYADTDNERVRCAEQKFQLRRGSANTFNLVCTVEEQS